MNEMSISILYSCVPNTPLDDRPIIFYWRLNRKGNVSMTKAIIEVYIILSRQRKCKHDEGHYQSLYQIK